MKEVAIIGGGAAGCFCAVELKRRRPDLDVTVYEAAARPMMKLAVTGGGRCNITNSFAGVDDLATVYPRGFRLMKKAFGRFDQNDCLRWFGELGIAFTVQDDGCVFPVSQDAMQIVRALDGAMRALGVKVLCNKKIIRIGTDLSMVVADKDGGTCTERPSAVVLTSGGGTADILDGTGIAVEPHVPSLFTLKLSDIGIRSLMGTVVDNVSLGLAGTNFRSHGTLLLTDWGVSGPATLRLSSYAARWLAESQYRGTLLINWVDGSEEYARELLGALARQNRGKMIANCHPSVLSDRLWRMLVERSAIRPDCRWAELGSKGCAKLVNTLISDTYEINGRAKFKEEFVTCGGVSLKEVNSDTMEARKVPGLFFAGEVLDIDAVTGGFNLQAAWSTAWVAAQSITYVP